MPKRRVTPNLVFTKQQVCEVCGKVFYVKPYNQNPPIYCSVPCCQRAYRARKEQKRD